VVCEHVRLVHQRHIRALVVELARINLGPEQTLLLTAEQHELEVAGQQTPTRPIAWTRARSVVVPEPSSSPLRARTEPNEPREL
jgi:hypothetical protein